MSPAPNIPPKGSSTSPEPKRGPVAQRMQRRTDRRLQQEAEETQRVQTSENAKRHPLRTAAWAVVVLVLITALFSGLFYGLSKSGQSTGPARVNAAAVNSDRPFYVLLIGSDSRKGTALYTGKASEHAQVDEHSDVMTLMRVDQRNYTITLVTIPRDTVLAGETAKINDSLLDNDPNAVVASVEKLTGVHVNFYMMTTFMDFEELIDDLGGITVDVPESITVPDPATGADLRLEAGSAQHLDGAEALVLARARKSYGDDQDAKRQTNVRNIERAIINTALAADGQDALEAAMGALGDTTTTNMDIQKATGVAMLFRQNADRVTIYSCTGPYEGHTRSSDGLWVVDDDQATWQQLMQVVEAGENPEFVVPGP